MSDDIPTVLPTPRGLVELKKHWLTRPRPYYIVRMRATLIPQSIMAAEFNYTKAVVCGVAASLPVAALRMDEPGEPVNLEKARKQHDEYVKVI